MPRLSVLCWVMGLGLSVWATTVRADEPKNAPSQPPAASGGQATKPAKAKAKPAPDAHAAAKPAKRKKSKAAPAPAPEATQTAAVTPTPAAPVAPVVAPVQPVKPKPAAAPGTACSLEEAELPRGGRLDVLGSGFGASPVVRIAQKPARMIERRTDRISVQIPADSDGGQITLQNEGHTTVCGTLVIIGKNR